MEPGVTGLFGAAAVPTAREPGPKPVIIQDQSGQDLLALLDKTLVRKLFIWTYTKMFSLFQVAQLQQEKIVCFPSPTMD